MMQYGIIENEDRIIVASQISDLVDKYRHQDNINKKPGTYI